MVDLGIDGYGPGQQIGEGGFAVVYRATQTSLGRPVAVKVLRGMRGNDKAVQLFRNECAIAGQLSWHPHIVSVHDAGTTGDGSLYLSMELLEAGSLADRVRTGPIDWETVTAWGVALAGALEAAHRRGLIHRDIKPGNVLLTGFDEPQLSDFGIARIGAGGHTRTGSVMGTVMYAAPELLGGSRASPVADVYSLGATLFTLVTGSPAFVSEDDESIAPLMHRIATNPVPSMDRWDVPQAVAAEITRAMAKEPAHRHPSMEAFGEALQGAQDRTGTPRTPLRIEASRARAPAPAAAPARPAPQPSAVAFQTADEALDRGRTEPNAAWPPVPVPGASAAPPPPPPPATAPGRPPGSATGTEVLAVLPGPVVDQLGYDAGLDLAGSSRALWLRGSAVLDVVRIDLGDGAISTISAQGRLDDVRCSSDRIVVFGDSIVTVLSDEGGPPWTTERRRRGPHQIVASGDAVWAPRVQTGLLRDLTSSGPVSGPLTELRSGRPTPLHAAVVLGGFGRVLALVGHQLLELDPTSGDPLRVVSDQGPEAVVNAEVGPTAVWSWRAIDAGRRLDGHPDWAIRVFRLGLDDGALEVFDLGIRVPVQAGGQQVRLAPAVGGCFARLGSVLIHLPDRGSVATTVDGLPEPGLVDPWTRLVAREAGPLLVYRDG